VIHRTQYAKTADGVYIAYQVIGDGPVDLSWSFDFVGNVDVIWEHPGFARWFDGLASFSRLILHDRRGTGLSSRNVPPPDLETRVADLRVVLDAAGSELPVLAGLGEGGAANALFAASEPDQVRSTIWWGPLARSIWAPDYPWGARPEYVERSHKAVEDHWGTDEYGTAFAEAEDSWDHLVSAEAASHIGKLSRHTATPDVAMEIERIWNEIDIRGVLPSVQVPSLLIWIDSGDRGEVEYVASLMPKAEVLYLQGEDESAPEVQAPALEAVRRFIGAEAPPSDLDRILATVLFTDVVDSTRKAAELGDARWKELLADHDQRARDQIARHRGNYVKGTGDGLLATFDGPARAVRCAQAIGEAVAPLGVAIRTGCHTGEIELVGDDVQGISVHIGARVAALAGAGEVLVSSTVKDLVAGSGLVFEDRGLHALKGVPDEWHLFAVIAG
jgi:class 3 adenylate cyclase